jgi:hypothetical protein
MVRRAERPAVIIPRRAAGLHTTRLGMIAAVHARKSTDQSVWSTNRSRWHDNPTRPRVCRAASTGDTADVVARVRPRERRPFRVRVRIARRSVEDSRELEWTVALSPRPKRRLALDSHDAPSALRNRRERECPRRSKPSNCHGLPAQSVPVRLSRSDSCGRLFACSLAHW